MSGIRNGELRCDNWWKKHRRRFCLKILRIMAKKIRGRFLAIVPYHYMYPGKSQRKFMKTWDTNGSLELRLLGRVPPLFFWNWLCLLSANNCKISSWHCRGIKLRSQNQNTKQLNFNSVRYLKLTDSVNNWRKHASGFEGIDLHM